MQQVPLLPQAGSINVNPRGGQTTSRGASTPTGASDSSSDSEGEEVFGIGENSVTNVVYAFSRSKDGDPSDPNYNDIEDPEDEPFEADATSKTGKVPGSAETGSEATILKDIRDLFWMKKRKSALDPNGEAANADAEAEPSQNAGSQATVAAAATIPLQAGMSSAAADKRLPPGKRFTRPDSNASLQDWYEWWAQALAEKQRREAEGNAQDEPYPGFTAAWNKLLEAATNFFTSLFANS
jgi:hypothetical protein